MILPRIGSNPFNATNFVFKFVIAQLTSVFQRGSASEGGVGETDGEGFGLGIAPTQAKQDKAAVIETRKIKSRKTKDRLGSGAKRSQPQSPIPDNEAADLPPPITPALSSIPPLHPPSSPPSKADAFEEFKRERGSEINRIFVENKSKYTYFQTLSVNLQ